LQKKFDKSCHLLGIAYNDVGYSNLVRLSSWAWIHGYYRRPRINHEVLMQYKEGIIFTSTCANSEIARAFFDRGEEAGYNILEKYMAMFGDKFYLELMMLDFKDQKPYDAFLIKAHDKYHIPLILTNDCHYCRKEHSHNQRLMLMQQNKKTLSGIQSLIESGKEDLFDPATNAKVAYHMSNGGKNWSAWTTYTSGKYQQFLDPKGGGTPGSPGMSPQSYATATPATLTGAEPSRGEAKVVNFHVHLTDVSDAQALVWAKKIEAHLNNRQEVSLMGGK
jgi:hypothetical protein